jgi:type I restriction enzyme M protein
LPPSAIIEFKQEIEKELETQKNKRNQRPIHDIAIEKCGFYLPPPAEYEYLLHLPEQKNIAKAIKQAMEEIEKLVNPNCRAACQKMSILNW